MKIILLFLIFFSVLSNATEIQWSTQHVNLKKQNQSGWQHNLTGKKNVTPELTLGLSGSYLKKFNLYDNSYGGLIGIKINEKTYVELMYNQGMGNKILPKRDSNLVSYYALTNGLTPFLVLKDSRYSDTKVQSASLGIEIEKWPNFLFIPQLMLGGSEFNSDRSNESVYSFGLRAIYYTENKFSMFAFGSKATEASQGITGAVVNNIKITSTTGGIGGSYYLLDSLKSEFSVEHTDYREIKNQYITSVLSLNYKF